MDDHIDHDGLESKPSGGRRSDEGDAGTHEADAADQVDEPSSAKRHEKVKATLTEFWRDQLRKVQAASTDIQDFKNHPLPLARIKKIMKSDEDVRMISSEAPILFAKACELFILELTHRSWAHSEENKRRTLQRNDIAAAIADHDVFEFLFDVVPPEEFGEGGPAPVAGPQPTAPTSAPAASAAPTLAPAPTTSMQPSQGMYVYTSAAPGSQQHMQPMMMSPAKSTDPQSSSPYVQYMQWPGMQQGMQPGMNMVQMDPMQVHVAQQMQAAQAQYMQRQQQMAKQGSVRLVPQSSVPSSQPPPSSTSGS